MITTADVEAAARRIVGQVRRTPVFDAGPFWLKLEQLQYTGSFKPRGAFNRILTAHESGALPETGVIAASGGNAGLGVAYAAAKLDVPSEIWVPEQAPSIKVEKLRSLGAKVVLHGSEYAEAYDGAVKRAADTGALFCHAYDQPEIVAGQGTLGLELAEDFPDLDTVLVAVGGGGLVAGIAAALEQLDVSVVGVEPENAPTLHAALDSGWPVDVAVSGIGADSLGARRCGQIAYDVAIRTGIRSLLVSDDDLVRARQELWDRYRLAVEHGTAAAYAAIMAGSYCPEPGERMCVVVCGANTDVGSLR